MGNTEEFRHVREQKNGQASPEGQQTKPYCIKTHRENKDHEPVQADWD